MSQQGNKRDKMCRVLYERKTHEDVCKKKVPRAVFQLQNGVQVGQEHESARKRLFTQVKVYTKP